MVQSDTVGSAIRMSAAARLLIEGDKADAEVGRLPRTIFIANLSDDPRLDRCVFQAALDAGVGAVTLRYGRHAGAEQPRANLALIEDGKRLEVRDCALWSEGEGPVLLVPADGREDCHFAVGPAGLERRSGRPAAQLGRGISHATARLERAAGE